MEFSLRKIHPLLRPGLTVAQSQKISLKASCLDNEAGAFTGAGKRRIGKLEFADKGTVFLG
ncbi:sigma 54-interacting transcriptional regulator [Vibrio lentus]|nr:sigma 54-interacting transcriptional regulator [Vibrio lentus]